jgi:hypothetical protein
MRAGRSWVVVALLAGLAPAHAAGQEGTGSAAPVHDVLSANPFLLIAEWFNAEWEHGLTPTSTAGVRVSRVDFGDPDATYTSARGFWRYYPDGAFEKFFFGFDGGVTSFDESGDTQTVLGVGFELGYDWLLGARRKFYVSLGAGADRLFAGDLGDASAVIPTVRLINIGVGF